LKFKYLVIIFCAVIFFILTTAVLLLLLVAGSEFLVHIKQIILPLVIFMVVILVFMGLFFFSNYRLFSLLEREDWPALSFYLEKQVYEKGRYSSRNVRLLASSYLVVSDYPSVIKLEKKILTVNPSLIRKNVLVFGSARILSGNHKESAAFFKTYADKCNGDENQWVKWFYGFSLLLSGDFSSAEAEFSLLAVSSDNALVTGLSSNFLYNTIAKHSVKTQECKDIAESGKQRVKNTFKNFNNWINGIEKIKSDIHIAIIKKYIDETGKWIFSL